MVALWLIEARRFSICNVLEWVTDKFSQPGNEPSTFERLCQNVFLDFWTGKKQLTMAF